MGYYRDFDHQEHFLLVCWPHWNFRASQLKLQQRQAGPRAGLSMLDKAEKILWPLIAARLGTEEGRMLLVANAAVRHLIVFALATSGFILIALVRRLNAGCHALIDACSASLMVIMFVSFASISVPNQLAWISCSLLLFLPLLLRDLRARGREEDGRSSSAERERSDAMLNKAERILLPVAAAFLVTEEGRVLLMSEAAAGQLIVFVLSIACFCILGLVRRLGFPGFVTPEHADHCSAFIKAVMLISLVGIVMHEELPWITYTPLLFILLLLVLAIVRICKLNIDENLAPDMNE